MLSALRFCFCGESRLPRSSEEEKVALNSLRMGDWFNVLRVAFLEMEEFQQQRSERGFRVGLRRSLQQEQSHQEEGNLREASRSRGSGAGEGGEPEDTFREDSCAEGRSVPVRRNTQAQIAHKRSWCLLIRWLVWRVMRNTF